MAFRATPQKVQVPGELARAGEKAAAGRISGTCPADAAALGKAVGGGGMVAELYRADAKATPSVNRRATRKE